MSELLSLAYVRPNPGKEQETLVVLAELYTLLHKKNYSRDYLYRDPKQPGRLLNLRYWRSEEARDEAHEDPAVHQLWQRLSEVSTVEGVIERFEEIEGPWKEGR